jgi:hypothetical protein
MESNKKMLNVVLISFTVGFFVSYLFLRLIKSQSFKRNLVTPEQLAVTPGFKEKNQINMKLKQAQEIAIKVDELLTSINNPSKNALHSRYKNGLIGEIKILETQKFEILESVLKDGFDPIIAAKTLETSEPVKMKLSEFIARVKSSSNKRISNLENKIKTNRHLRLIKNEAKDSLENFETDDEDDKVIH